MNFAKTLSWLGVVALGAAILTACSSATPAATEPATPPAANDGGVVVTQPPTDGDLSKTGTGLTGTSWTLTQIDGTVVDASIGATLKFDADKATGKGGCNGFGGGYTVSGSSITFSDIASTLMACDDAHMAVEGKYLPALQGTVSFTQSADTLVITGAKGVKLTFTASK